MAIGRSVSDQLYAVLILTPQLCDTSWAKLQTAQNAALRISTGCHLMSSIPAFTENPLSTIPEEKKVLFRTYPDVINKVPPNGYNELTYKQSKGCS